MLYPVLYLHMLMDNKPAFNVSCEPLSSSWNVRRVLNIEYCLHEDFGISQTCHAKVTKVHIPYVPI